MLYDEDRAYKKDRGLYSFQWIPDRPMRNLEIDEEYYEAEQKWLKWKYEKENGNN